MPRGDDDLLDLPPLPPLGSGEALGTEQTEVVINLDPGASEQVGLDDAEAQLEDLDPVSLLDDLTEALAPADASLAPGIEIDLGADVAAEGDEYGWRDGNEAPTAEEWVGDHGITTLAELGHDDGGETGLEDLAAGLQGDDALPSLPPLAAVDEDEQEPLADDLDLGDAMAIDFGGGGDSPSDSQETRAPRR